jgi:hypothetical protein
MMSASASADEVLGATEAWFRRQGLPYFVPEERGAARAALRLRQMLPLLVAVALAGLALAGLLTRLTAKASVAPGTVTFVALAAGLVYAVTKLRARPIVTFAVNRTLAGLGQLVPMATRALPLLLVFVTFLFINAEVWMLSASLDGALLWLTVLLFSAVAAVFLLVRLPEEVDRLDDRIDPELLVTASRDTPVASAAKMLVDERGPELDLPADAEVRGYERGNLIVVLAVIQAAQVLLMSLAVFVFFLLFGALTMEEAVQAAWIGDGVRNAPVLEHLSVELLQVSVFLAAFSGLYFTVYVVTDDMYREQFFTGVLRELEREVAVLTVYRHLRRRREAEAGHPDAAEDGVPTRTLPAAEPEDPSFRAGAGRRRRRAVRPRHADAP